MGTPAERPPLSEVQPRGTPAAADAAGSADKELGGADPDALDFQADIPSELFEDRPPPGRADKAAPKLFASSPTRRIARQVADPDPFTLSPLSDADLAARSPRASSCPPPLSERQPADAGVALGSRLPVQMPELRLDGIHCPDSLRDHLVSWLDSGGGDFSNPPTGRVQLPYRQDAPPTGGGPHQRLWDSLAPGSPGTRWGPNLLGHMQEQQRQASSDGTVGVHERSSSPPVVGRMSARAFTSGRGQRQCTPMISAMMGEKRGAFAMNVLAPAAHTVQGPPCAAGVPELRRDSDSGGAVGSRAAPWTADGAGPGRRAQAAEEVGKADGAGTAPSVFAFLRGHFSDVDVECKGHVTEEELFIFVQARAKRRLGGKIPQEVLPLLRASAKRFFFHASLRPDGIHLEDWVNFGLLLPSAPSPVLHHFLCRRLRGELARSPLLLKEILAAFEEADVRGAGSLRSQDILDAFVGGHEIVKLMSLGALGELSYYEFVAFCLGYRRSQVVLNWYDVSQGYAQWVPKAVLGGTPLDGIWHTGVVAFGREYWYGGKVLSSEPGKAPFPPGPVRSTSLGHTMCTREELEDYLRFEAAPRYTRENYDVLRHNCNHFSDEVANFLIQGCHIPDEARLQPEAVMNAPLLFAVRGYLNRYLSSFNLDACDDAIDDLTSEWRARLWPGDLALYVPGMSPHHSEGSATDQQEPVRLVRVSNVDAWRGSCDIGYFEPEGPKWEEGPLGMAASAMRERITSDVRVRRLVACIHSGSFWDWNFVRQESVPLLSLRPHALADCKRQLESSCTGAGIGSAAVALGFGSAVLASQRASDLEIQQHLARRAIVYAHCPKGHGMQIVRPARTWSLGAKLSTCGICGKSIAAPEPRLECSAPSCSGFCLCGACDRRGLFQGYYSLGTVDATAARALLQEPAWIRYKAQRYLAAAGASEHNAWKGRIGLEVWQHKVSVRVYADMCVPLPSKVQLLETYQRLTKRVALDKGEGWSARGLCEEAMCDLLLELLAVHAACVSL